MRCRGFTLVELIVTLLVASLLVAASVPNFVSTLARFRGHQAREELVQRLRAARQQAISRHCPVAVQFGNGIGTTGISDIVVHIDSNGDLLSQSSERRIAYVLPKGTTLGPVELTPRDSLVFDVGGALWPGGTGGRIVINSRNGADTVLVSAVGMVYRP